LLIFGKVCSSCNKQTTGTGTYLQKGAEYPEIEVRILQAWQSISPCGMHEYSSVRLLYITNIAWKFARTYSKQAILFFFFFD